LSRRSTCFIATACYGSDSREVTILKQFRDEHLVKNKIGNIFVTIYYKISPHLCRLLHNDKPIKKATKFFLKIIVRHMEKIIRERRNG